MTVHQTPVAAMRADKGTAPLTITCVNPLDHAEEIKGLFLAHERPEFPQYFERAYRGRAGEGAKSWIGRDEHGTLRAYIALFPRRFRFGGRVVHGGLLANMMVATAYRTFWPGLALVRQLVKDAQASGSLDLVYGDPNEGARALAERSGLRLIGTLRRFVLPVADRRRGVDVGIQAYQLIRRWAGPAPLAVSEPARAVPDPPAYAPEPDARILRPLRDASLYRARLSGYPDASDWWFTFHAKGSPDAPVATALVRGPDARGVAAVCAFECESATQLGSLLAALARPLRRVGAARLEIGVLADSADAWAVRRAGFVQREDRTPILAAPFTEVGTAVVAAGAQWRLQPIDLDR